MQSGLILEALVAVSRGVERVVRHKHIQRQRQMQLYTGLGIAALTAIAALYPALAPASTSLNKTFKHTSFVRSTKVVHRKKLLIRLQAIQLALQAEKDATCRNKLEAQQEVILELLGKLATP